MAPRWAPQIPSINERLCDLPGGGEALPAGMGQGDEGLAKGREGPLDDSAAVPGGQNPSRVEEGPL